MNSPIDICLISPPIRASSTTVPVALLYLHAWLKKNGVTAAIVDIKAGALGIPLSSAQIEQVKSKIIDTVLRVKPKVVGIPCYTAEFWDVIDLCARIRQNHTCTVIVGGLHATIRPLDFCYNETPVDAVVLGDGQQPLLEIISRVNSGKALDAIDGVHPTGSQTLAASDVSFDEWNALPIPDYAQLDMAFYTRPHTGIIRNVIASGIHIFTTIGCPFSCTFCANSSRKVRFRPIDDVIREIALLKQEYKIDSFYVLDDTFMMKKERVKEFVAKLEASNIGLMWAMETRVNLLDEETLRLVKNAGCIQIDFGVESGSRESLKRMKKGITTEQIITSFALCRKYKMRTYANYMFNTPEEKKEDVEQTIAMIQRTKPTRVSICLTVPFPGTELYDEYVKPPLSKEEYRIYNTKYLYVQIADPRFSMTRHSLDLVGLRISTAAKMNGLRNIIDLTLNPVYWKSLAKSKRKLHYVVAYTKGIFLIAAEKVRRMIKISRERASK